MQDEAFQLVIIVIVIVINSAPPPLLAVSGNKTRFIFYIYVLKSANSDTENLHKKVKNVPLKKIIYNGIWKVQLPKKKYF